MNTIKSGTVIHGTLRAEDLINAFARLLQELAPEQYANLLVEADEVTDYESDEACEILVALETALSEIAPEGMYFGTHPGDASDFGFWHWETAED